MKRLFFEVNYTVLSDFALFLRSRITYLVMTERSRSCCCRHLRLPREVLPGIPAFGRDNLANSNANTTSAEMSSPACEVAPHMSSTFPSLWYPLKSTFPPLNSVSFWLSNILKKTRSKNLDESRCKHCRITLKLMSTFNSPNYYFTVTPERSGFAHKLAYAR